MLHIKLNESLSYHMQSQDQIFKSLLHAYRKELDKDLEEGLPWLILAGREAVQVSIGFFPKAVVKQWLYWY